MAWSACAFETVTGKYIAPLDCDVQSWGRELNGTDTGSVKLSPGTLTTATRDFYRLITTPWRSSLAILWNQIPIFAGPIITRPFDGKQVTINAQGVKTAIFSRRKAHTWATPFASQVLAYSNMSLGSIAQALAQVGTAAGKPGASLPIVYPSTEADTDPTHVRNYNGFELKNIADLWSDLTSVINGPDIDFQPGWTDSTQTFLQYAMRIGTLAQPKLFSAQQVVFDAAQPGSPVRSLGYTEDASQQTTTEWAEGSGSDVGTLMSQATSTSLTSQGWPLLEEEIDYKTVVLQATLDSATAGDLATNLSPATQLSMSVDATQPPAFGTYLLGDQARVRVANNVWVPDGDYPMRIVGMSGSASTEVNLEVQAA